MPSTMLRYISGGFTPRELKRYLLGISLWFWGLILISWLNYPAEHHYSIMTHTFSFLGSFAEKHNPETWWIFSIAMGSWAFGMVPLALYLRRRFARVSRFGAAVGAFFFFAGAAGILGVASFPDAPGEVIGDWEWTDIHEKVAILIAIGFFLGILWHGALLLKDRFLPARRREASGLVHRAFLWPYLFWGTITGAAAYNQITWARLYAEKKAAAAASGAHIGSSWSEAMNTIYSFPLWENLVIYTLFAFMMWFSVAASRDTRCAGRV